MKYLLFLLFPVLLFSYEAKVIKVRSGSYITVQSNTNIIQVKLWGIDAPDSSQKYSYESMMFLSNMIFNKTVQIKDVFIDPFGRPHSLISYNNIGINFMQITNGNCVVYFIDTPPPDTKLKWKTAEAEAKIEKIGLWKYNQVSPYQSRMMRFQQMQEKK